MKAYSKLYVFTFLFSLICIHTSILFNKISSYCISDEFSLYAIITKWKFIQCKHSRLRFPINICPIFISTRFIKNEVIPNSCLQNLIGSWKLDWKSYSFKLAFPGLYCGLKLEKWQPYVSDFFRQLFKWMLHKIIYAQFTAMLFKFLNVFCRRFSLKIYRLHKECILYLKRKPEPLRFKLNFYW